MGLDAIEVVMDVEEAFQITIKDAEAEHIGTVGDMYHLVASKVGPLPGNRCLSAVAFNRLRRAIRAVLPDAPARLRPNTPIGEALPVAVRRAAWPRLTEATAFRLPGLDVSGVTCGILLGAAFLDAVLVGVFVGGWTQAGVGVLAGIMGFVLLAAVVNWLGRRMGRHLRSCRTLGDLAHRVLWANFGAIARECGAGYDRELWAALCRVIGDTLGVDAGELRPEQSFVKDLNVG